VADAAQATIRGAPTPTQPVSVVELPREVVLAKLLPLLPARTLLRARVVCRCGP